MVASTDAENRLVTNWVASAWKSEFVYDGLGRRRIERDYGWTGTWSKTNELHFIYDAFLLIQVRDANNNVLVTYMRGLDLSGSLAGAGGIGGLLARTDSNGSAFYHIDGAGNVTALIDNYQIVQARYEYSPFGRLIGKWGALADANEMQFSSMSVSRLSGIVGYWGRTYDPTFQRWLQRDPIGEAGGVNLYQFVGNNPVNFVDPYGLLSWSDFNPGLAFSGTAWKNLPSWIINDVLIGNTGGTAPNPSSQLAQAQAAGLGISPIRDENGNLQNPGELTTEVMLAPPKGVAMTAMMMLGPSEEEGAAEAGGGLLKWLKNLFKRKPKCPNGPRMVDPSKLRLPPPRTEGADPFKLANQIRQYGKSTEGMPPLEVTVGQNGEMMINSGVTRATRAAMTPGTQVPVQVIEVNPGLNLGNLPTVGQRLPGSQ